MSRVVLVTGASAGIGRLVASMLAAAGDTVYVNARRKEQLDALAAEHPEGRIVPVVGDLTDREFRDTLIDHVVSDAGRIDVLINNAGFGNIDPVDVLTNTLIRDLYELNVLAVIELTRSALIPMKKQKHGRIMNVSSLVGFLPVPYMALYNSSKRAVNGFTETLRMELSGTGVTATAVCPGQVDTEFGDHSLGTALPKRLRGEPASRVAKGIVRKIDADQRWVFPTFQAWMTHLGWVLLPWLTRIILATVGKKQMRALIASRD